MKADILEKYGNAIRNLRRKRHVSQKAFADLCGLHRTYISDIERGLRNVSLENVEKIAVALNVKISDVFIEIEKLNNT